MLYRKIQKTLESYFKGNSNKIMIIDGARQVGKSYIIRYVGNKLFENYIEINLLEDSLSDRLFENIMKTEDFYFQLSMIAGEKMKQKENTLVFLDEIQAYPQLLTLLKFLKAEDRFTYIASGSLLGVTLYKTASIPIGSIECIRMYPLDFEEFLYANGMNQTAIETIEEKLNAMESLDLASHNKIMDLFKKYLLIGGLPDAVNTYLAEKNIVSVRNIQTIISDYYGADAARYDLDHKLKIKRIYEMIPSTLENKKKRIVIKEIENIKGKRVMDYVDEFDYLIHSGIALEVKAISNPVFPLIETSGKNLLKLYLNDVGLLTNVYYKNNIRAILDENKSINLGTVYETVVSQELKAHGFKLYYYDNKSKGEVDFLIDDYETLSVIPIEVKSGKDYSIHSALSHLISNGDYPVSKAYVLSNEREVSKKGNIYYLPIYYVMFLKNN